MRYDIGCIRNMKGNGFRLLSSLFFLCLVCICSNNAFAVENEARGELVAESGLTDSELKIYSMNNILFFERDNCAVSGSSSSTCGNTAKEIYWSALSKYIDDPIKVAGVMGNLATEGNMNPVAWEGAITNSDGTLKYGWDVIYGGNLDGNYGVGAFGITSGLSKYLHYVNDSDSDLLRYFMDSSNYGFNYIYPGSGANPTYGDTLLEKIGNDEFGRLVELEIKYAIESFNPSTTQDYLNTTFSSPSDAAYWWMDQWERPGYRNPEAREAAAEKIYDELSDFKCSTSTNVGSSDSSSPSNAGITLIGDSISVMSEKELQNKFPGAFMSKVGSRHSTSEGMCGDNGSGGIGILDTIISGSGTVRNQNYLGECDDLGVDSNSLKENVVWELGTNSNGATEETIERVIKRIDGRKLFLVTPYNGLAMNSADSIADMYRGMADKYNNVYVVDWNKAVRDNESKYITRSDGMAVHPTEEGKKLLADLIAEAVGSTANCAMDSSYKDAAYKKRLEGLDTFNQVTGTFKDEQMCSGKGWSISGAGCGLMSLYAAYYMFTGEGLNDHKIFNDIRAAAHDDNYIPGCEGGSEPNNRTSGAIEKYTGIKIENGNGESGRINEKVEEYYKDSDWNKFIDALNQGKKIIIEISGRGGTRFTSPTGYHYMLIDHYDADKDAVYLFDPSMGQWKVDASGVEVGPSGDIKDGVYVTRKQMADSVKPHGWWWLNYYGQSCKTVCRNDGAGGLKEGGMSKKEAEDFMKPYIEEASKMKWGNYGKGTQNSNDAIGGFEADGLVNGVGAPCPSTLNNCSAFSQWFVNNFTSFGSGAATSYMGYATAKGMARDYGLEDGGFVPRPYAVFSMTGYNHTGVVLGIDEQNGKMYTGEAHCLSGDPPGVEEYSLDYARSGAFIYSYTDKELKMEKFTK